MLTILFILIRMSAEMSILKFFYLTSAYFSVSELNCNFISVLMYFLEISVAFVIANFFLLIFRLSLCSLQSLSTIHVCLVSFSFRRGEAIAIGGTIYEIQYRDVFDMKMSKVNQRLNQEHHERRVSI